MRFTGFIAVGFSVVILVSLTGCASMGGGQISGINWALAKNGGRVGVFSDDPYHPGATLINGVTSSEGWYDGEGWQAPITTSLANASDDDYDILTLAGRRRRVGSVRRGRNWVIIELAQPVTVSNVKIYTIDSAEYPASSFGVSSLVVQYEFISPLKDKMWVSAERFGKGINAQDNRIDKNTSGVIDVKFKPVSTDRIRLLIYRTNDLARSRDGKSNRTLEGMIRLIEVEVYGVGKHEKRDELEDLFGK